MLSRHTLPASSLALLCLISISACVSGPFNGQPHDATTQAITVAGYSSLSSQTVYVYSSASRSGPFTLRATSQSATSPTIFPDGTELYAYRTTITVPAAGWSANTACGTETFVRVRAGAGFLVTFDDPNLSGVEPGACIQGRMTAGDPLPIALQACASPESPLARVVVLPANPKPRRHAGDLVISSAAAATSWECLEVLDGNLAIDGPSIALPRLRSIRGDLTVEYPAFVDPLRPGYGVVRAFSAPRLLEVAGDVTLTNATTPTAVQTLAMDVGFPALATIDGSLSISSSAPAVAWRGLPSLTTVEVDLHIASGGGGDVTGYAFLTALAEVGGNTSFTFGGGAVSHFVGALQTVRGYLYWDSADITAANVLVSLTSIGSHLTIRRASCTAVAPHRCLPALQSVSGGLVFRYIDNDTLLFGAANLRTPALAVSLSEALRTLGANNISLDLPADIYIVGNRRLCRSSIEAWVAQQPQGWVEIFGVDDGC